MSQFVCNILLQLLIPCRREGLSESTSPLSPESRQLASLLCSKLYFYLGALSEAVDTALNAGEAFGRDRATEYKETIIGESR